MSEGTRKYDDIISLPHHVSSKHPRMSMEQRAAQFAPFAALAGHDEHIRDAARNARENGPDGESYFSIEEMP